MSVTEFKRAVARCNFLLDGQKEKLLGMLDGMDDEYSSDGNGNGHIHADDIFHVLDNVLWRTMGVGLDSLPVGDRVGIERAVREVAY